MIRGHRRKGFKNPPMSNGAIASEETPKPSKRVEEKQCSPSPIKKNCGIINIAPSTIPEVRNKRLFDSSGFHDPKNALQPAKIRLRKMKFTLEKETPQTSSSNVLKFPSNIHPSSPKPIAPLSTTEHSYSLAASLQPQQKQQPPPILHSQTKLNTKNTLALNSSETKRPSAIKHGRRIKITPRRDLITNLSEKLIGSPKISQHMPAIMHPNSPYASNQRIAILSDHQSNFGTCIYKIAANLIDTLILTLFLCNS